jgi:uncharacterized protein (TIGR03435 family)
MKIEWRKVLAWGLSAAAIVGIAFAQAGPAFEVALVRGGGARPGIYRMRVTLTPERVAFQATQVGDIMAFAYGFPLDRIERRPQWMYDDFYDVAVTTAAPASLAEQKLLLQKLLEERFGLVVHRISTESPVYFLVAGTKVNLTETKAADSVDLPRFGGDLPAGTAGRPFGVTHVARHVSMSDLAGWLYSQVRLPVLDKTGITGWFDIEIPGLPIRGGAEGTIRAVHDALGLDLEVHRGQAESLLIDHAERPDGN